MLAPITRSFLADWRSRPPHVAVLRALRSCRVLAHGDARTELFANAAYQAHVRAVAAADEIFFLSHRHYLVRGLTAAQRVAAAAHHYRHELQAFDRGYFDRVHAGAGLELWRAEAEGTVFDLVLQPGNDVLYEGGASLVLRHEGQRICVLSYSTLPASLFAPAAPAADSPPSSVLFVTRKQPTSDYSYQRVFHKAFERTTAGHVCFAALTGLALALGHRSVVGIATDSHPSTKPDREQHFRAAYDEFWTSLGGVRDSRLGYRVPVPMQFPPLEELDAKHRKRANARRAHLDAVRASAQRAIAARLSSSASR